MSLLWVISGVGRGVGKTHLGLALCEVLPASTYAKHGHGTPKDSKPRNFFRNQADLEAFITSARDSMAHVVVESNCLAWTRSGDITIFVDAPGVQNPRKNAAELCALADMRIARGSSVRDWKKRLRAKLGDASLCEAVCDVLARQKRYLYGNALDIRTKVWFQRADQHAFGTGLAQLLERVKRFGTLSEAARESHMSYRYAWGLIKQVEEHLGKKLLIRHPGGPDGGQSSLSDEGQRLLMIFRRLNSEVARFADERFAVLYGQEASND